MSGVTERGIWVEKVVQVSSELDPLAIRGKRGKMSGHGEGVEYILRGN